MSLFLNSALSRTVFIAETTINKYRIIQNLHFWLETNLKKWMYFNPFQESSLGNAHCTAWGPKSPEEIGLFGPLPPVQTNSPHSFGLIAEAPFAPLLMWACKLLRKAGSSRPPPRNTLIHHRAAAKIRCGTRIHTAFWAWRLHWTKKYIKGFRKSFDKAFCSFKIENFLH